jgi:integrase
MVRLKIRYLVLKPQAGGRVLFYWQPSHPLRAAGFLPRRLAETTNTLADAVAEAERLNTEVDAWRTGAARPAINHGTLPWLIRLYRTDSAYTELAPKTQRGYDQCIEAIEAWSERAGHKPIATIERKHVKAFYRAMESTPAKANAVMRVLRLILNFAMDEGALSDNPAERQRLTSRPPRQAIWKPEDVRRFVETAKASGRASMALAVLLGASLGQREGDILALGWSQYDGAAIALRQRKTGRLIAVPVIVDVRAALDVTAKVSPSIIVSETTGAPYREDHFRHEFARLRAAAGLDGLWFMDLRRTAVVWLAEAGCSVPEISAVTGHQLDRTVRILETYLPRNTTMARHAITRLEAYRKATKLEG